MDKSEASIAMASTTSEDFEKYDAPERVNEMGDMFSKAEDKKDIVTEDLDGDSDDFHHHDDPDDHDDHKGPKTCREKLKDFLHTQAFQIAVIVLVVLDCIFVIGELVLDYEALAEAKNCGTAAPPSEGNTSDHAEISRYRREAEGITPSEEEHEEESATAKAAEALHYLSLIILSVFMVELLLKLVALGTKFFHSKLEVFDAIIIIISFVLDIVTLLFSDNFAVVDLIVVLRLWRIVRIVNGVILSVEQRAEKRIHHYKRLKERALQAAMTFEKYSTALEEEIQILRELLGTSGVKIDEELFKSKPDKPQFDKLYHMEDENGHHHHLHLPHLPHLPHLHLHHHHNDHAEGDGVNKSHPPDTNKPPDYDALHHSNIEATC